MERLAGGPARRVLSLASNTTGKPASKKKSHPHGWLF
jgi:hypothetical protein